MALAADLTMSECKLLPAKAGPGLFRDAALRPPSAGSTTAHGFPQRGDRGVLAYASSYDVLLQATMAITRHADDVAAAFRRMVFNVLASNRDDHTRQHSYLMDSAGQWRLAPAYDLTYSSGPNGEHYLDVEGEGRNPTRAQVLALGRRHGLAASAANGMIDEVRAAVDAWPRFAADAGVTRTSLSDIRAAHASVAAHFQS